MISHRFLSRLFCFALCLAGSLAATSAFGQGGERAEENWLLPAQSAPPVLCIARIGENETFIYRKLVPYTNKTETVEYVDTKIVREENGREVTEIQKRPFTRTVEVTKYFAEEFSCPLANVQFASVDRPGELASLEEAKNYFGDGSTFQRALMLTESTVVERQHAYFYDDGLLAFRISKEKAGKEK